eukprot:TRINITY_DN2966_c3_g1_i1.p1 TRINITY_DN2966_c3_g1~~TRINITY_DN2966_c3_g1_i1.p1  ORF type:complete len:1062 (+),score=325.88 TRINITY_DN2966_c3_g1_i1:113-3298(+)
MRALRCAAAAAAVLHPGAAAASEAPQAAAAPGPPGAGAVCPNYASESWLSMLAWVSVGGGSWRIDLATGGRTLEQFVNTPHPGFYVSDPADAVIDVVVSGTITVESVPGIKDDDDYVGMAFGFQGPLPWGDQDSYDTMLFSWGGQSILSPVYGYYAHEYMNIHKISGTVPKGAGHSKGDEGICFFVRSLDLPPNRPSYGHNASKPYPDNINASAPGREPWAFSPDQYCAMTHSNKDCVAEAERLGCFVLAYKEDSGWVRDVTYSFTALFTEKELTVLVQGGGLTRRISVTREQAEAFCQGNLSTAEGKARCSGGWKKGRVAWYNLSQHGVKYGNTRLFQLTPEQVAGSAAEPVAQRDVYRVPRSGSGSEELQPLAVKFYDGVLANDYSPVLETLTVEVGGGAVSAPVTITTEKGSSVVLQPDGALEYTPLASLSAATEGAIDRFTYTTLSGDGAQRRSTEQEVLFALTPPKAALDRDSQQWKVTWAESHDASLAWYRAISQGTVFGLVQAAGKCGPILDWVLTDGGAEGRFRLRGAGNDGVNIVADDPTRLQVRPKVPQSHNLRVQATDVWGTRHSVYVTIQIPAACLLEGTCECGRAACECSGGWAGANCSDCASTRLPPEQQQDGSCAACAAGWIGADCSVQCSAAATCSGHGSCEEGVLAGRLGQCNCDPGWYPLDVKACPAGGGQCAEACSLKCECANDTHGACAADPAAPAEGAVCECHKGWAPQGRAAGGCGIPCSCSEQHGTCGADGRCSCEPGWGPPAPPGWTPGDAPGLACSCQAAVQCSGHGDCVWRDGAPRCECEAGWLPAGADTGPGAKCVRYCVDAQCGGHGSCRTGGALAGLCACAGHWGGPNCTECESGWYPPPGRTALRSAEALAENSSANASAPTAAPSGGPAPAAAACTLQCQPDWAGAWAGPCATLGESTRCCSGRGSCALANGSASCQCIAGWSGTSCDEQEWLTAPYIDYDSPSYMDSPAYKATLGAAAEGETGEDCAILAVGGKCVGILLVVMLALCCAGLLCYLWVRKTLGQHTTSKKRGAKLRSYEIDQSMLEGIDD